MVVKQTTFAKLGADLHKQLTQIVTGINIGILDAAQDAHSHMLSYLKTFPRLRQRRPGKRTIGSYIKLYYLGKPRFGSYRVGIGSIALLDRYAPYWYVLDKGKYFTGGSVPSAAKGFFKDNNSNQIFLPGASPKRDQIFYPASNFPLMVPHKPYRGIGYISNTYEHLLRRLKRYIEIGIVSTVQTT